MPIKMMVGGIEVTVDSPAEAAALLQSMNAVPPPSVEDKKAELVLPAVAPTPKPERAAPSKFKKITWDKVHQVREMARQGYTVQHIAKTLDFKPLAVSRCIKEQTYKGVVEQNQPAEKPQEPVKLPPLPPAPTPTTEDEVVELLLMGESPSEVAKAYKITPWTLIGIWNLKFDRAKRNEDRNTASSMSKLDSAIQLWAAQQKTNGFRPR